MSGGSQITRSGGGSGSGGTSTTLLGAFGEQITAHKTPIIQIDNKYKIDPAQLDDIETFEATGGSADNNGNLFRCSTGNNVGGYGVVRSLETLNYKGGQGVEGMITSMFTAGVANSLQFAGIFSLTETVAFGFDGVNFSCLHSYGGQAEVQKITVTVTGAGTCTVTLDDDSVGITVTNSTVQTNAFEIEQGLAGDATLSAKWRFEQVNDAVYVIAKSVGDKTGTFSVSGGVTANIVEQTAGGLKTDGHIAQADWNITTSPFEGFNPLKINIYKVQFGYLGAADIVYSIYNPSTREFVAVHQIEWANANEETHIGMPNFKIGWTSASLGSSGADLVVQGASASLMIEGDEVLKNNAKSATNTKSGLTTTLTNILTIKNRTVFADLFNLGKILPVRISVDNDHTKGISVEIYKDPDVAGTLNNQYINEYNSVALKEVAGGAVTNGELIDAFTVEKGADQILDLSILDTDFTPDSTWVIAARTISGTAATTSVTATWKEKK
jgi:hypothetical protein